MKNSLVVGTWMRLLATLVLLALVYLATLIPLPGVDMSHLGPSGHFNMSIVALGLSPFLFGFVAVELLSFIFPMGGRLRRGGILGRRKLNIYAVYAGVGVALVQAVGIVFALRNAESVMFAGTGSLSPLLCVMTLVGGAAFMFAVAKLVSRWGIGNGFCMVLVFLLLQDMARSPGSYWLTKPSFWVPSELAVILAAVGLLVWKFRQHPPAESATAQQESVPLLTLPAFSQGIVPVTWAYAMFNLQSSLRMLYLPSPDLERSLMGLLVMAVLIAAFSFITSYFFSSPWRLARSLPPGASGCVAPQGRRCIAAVVVSKLSAACASAVTQIRPIVVTSKPANRK